MYVLLIQGGQLTPIDLIIEETFHRAAPGGMGGTKAAGNYSPVSWINLDLDCASTALICTALSLTSGNLLV